MSFEAIDPEQTKAGKPIDKLLMDKGVRKNLDALYALAVLEESEQINGGFEKDTDGDGVPDGWGFAPIGTGTGAIDASTQVDGSNCFKFMVTGGGSNGGGALTQQVLSPIPNFKQYADPGFSPDVYVAFWHRCSTATMSNKIEVEFLDHAQASLGLVSGFAASSGQTDVWKAACFKIASGSVPSGAQFMRLVITGGLASSAVGIWRVDRVRFFTPARHGVFLNLTGGAAGDAAVDTHLVTVGPNSVFFEFEATGAGGGGGDDNGVAGGGGGGAGAYAKGFLPCTPEQTYSCNVGKGGLGVSSGNNPGKNGGTTTVASDATTVTLGGGHGGAGGGAGGSGGAASGYGTNHDYVHASDGSTGGNEDSGTGGSGATNAAFGGGGGETATGGFGAGGGGSHGSGGGTSGNGGAGRLIIQF